MVKRSFSLIVAVILIGCLAFSALAVDVTSYDFSDSGIQVFAAPQRAAALAAAADTVSATAGDYGYNFYPATILCQYQPRTNNTAAIWIPSGVYDGHYYFVFTFDSSVSAATSVYVNGQSTAYPCTKSVDGNSAIFDITFDNTSAPSGISFFVSFPNLASTVSFVSYDSTLITSVDGISSGFTYSSGAISDRDHQDFDTISASFGDQPAGDYLINIYHWGQSYDVDFALLYNGRYLTSSTNGGVTTAVVSHGGGDLTITGSFNIVRTTNWDIVGGSFFDGAGSIVTDAPGSWTFNITDIVAIPLSNAGLEQYGIFGPVVGFFCNQTSEIKSFFSGLFEKYFGADTTKIDEASSKVEEEQNEIDQATEDFSNAASSASDIVSNDFVVSSDVTGAADGFQSIFSSFFSALGVFSIFIWLPVLLGVVRVVLKL